MSYTSGKYDCARDEVLDLMVSDAWGNESSGNVESTTGHFARVCNAAADMESIQDAFGEEIATIGLSDTNELVGNFIVTTNDQGFVRVAEYDSEAECIAAYKQLDIAYGEWLGDDDSLA